LGMGVGEGLEVGGTLRDRAVPVGEWALEAFDLARGAVGGGFAFGDAEVRAVIFCLVLTRIEVKGFSLVEVVLACGFERARAEDGVGEGCEESDEGEGAGVHGGVPWVWVSA